MLNQSNIVTIKTKPVAEVNVVVLHCRSLRNKTASIIDHIIDEDLQCLALTETWLRTSDIDQRVIGEVTPEGYSLHHVPRLNKKGCGIGLLIRDSFKVLFSHLLKQPQ